MTKTFWTDLAERGVSTAAQAALGVVIASGFGLLDISSWKAIAVAAGGAALIAVLKAFGAGRGGDVASPSKAEPEPVYEEVGDDPSVDNGAE